MERRVTSTRLTSSVSGTRLGEARRFFRSQSAGAFLGLWSSAEAIQEKGPRNVFSAFIPPLRCYLPWNQRPMNVSSAVQSYSLVVHSRRVDGWVKRRERRGWPKRSAESSRVKGTSGNLISRGEAFARRIHEPCKGA